jgi:putative flippase GtrA
VSLAILTLLVETTSIPKVPAQLIAVTAATPLNFLGNKLWSFAR